MNLTNDNNVGCQLIASCGGLEMLSCLIARHFPSFGRLTSDEKKGNTLFNGAALGLEIQTDIHLNEQELDFLVTILGLLVNLVENDADNRFVKLLLFFNLPCLHAFTVSPNYCFFSKCFVVIFLLCDCFFFLSINFKPLLVVYQF